MSQNETSFEAECRALYERHKVVGFFTYMTEHDTALRGQLRAYKDDRRGILIGALSLSTQLLGNIAQSERATASAGA